MAVLMRWLPLAGLKATFTTAYMHTVIIFIVCLVFAFKVYVPGDLLAGVDQVCPPAVSRSDRKLSPSLALCP